MELATILRAQGEKLIHIVPNAWKHRALFAISRCRTAQMGGHIDQCQHPGCKKLHISYNSCRNRHCPKCQGHKREAWIQAREEELLNCPYFHLVFTLPDALNEIALKHPREVYNTLFKASWSTLRDFGENPKMLGAKTGMIALLHSWGQNLSLHPHLHCIVPAGGLTKSGKWKNTKAKGKFLFPIKPMAKVFRARFVAELRKLIQIPQQTAKKLFAKQWVIYTKKPFLGPKQVIEYLGRYTHKVAISNSRILQYKDEKVYFEAKNYRKGGKKEGLQLEVNEFIRRFALHILPKGFTRIRHFGILSSSTKRKNKIIIDQQIGPAITNTKKNSCHRICPICKIGQLKTLATFGQRGPPQWFLLKLQSKNSAY